MINQFKRLFSSYALKYNNRHKRKGPLFQNKLKRIFIDNDDRLRYYIGYAHHNPIHHHISASCRTWKYSSYVGILSSKESSIEKEKVLLLFDKVGGFEKYHGKFKLMKKEEMDNLE